MRILTGNIGNSNTQIANWLDDRIEKVVTFATQRLSEEKIILKKPDLIFTAGTVPDMMDKWKKIVRNLWDMEVFSVSSNFGLKIDYKGNLGQDRIANLAGAYLLLGSSFIVIDFGTATTLDLVIDKEYRGGVIFAGIDMALGALYRWTSLLPRIEFKKTDNLLAKETRGCIQSGAYWGELARIEGMVKRIDQRDCSVIITGGAGEMIAEGLGYRYDRWLTLRGIKYIADLLPKR